MKTKTVIMSGAIIFTILFNLEVHAHDLSEFHGIFMHPVSELEHFSTLFILAALIAAGVGTIASGLIKKLGHYWINTKNKLI